MNKILLCAAILSAGTVSAQTTAENDVELTYFGAPYYVEPNAPSQFYGTITNKGSKPVKSIELTYSMGNESATTKTTEISPLAQNETTTFSVDNAIYTGTAGMSIPMSLTITKVNGVADSNPQDNNAQASFWSAAKSFERMMVVEEGTGTWCGYCPRGMVGLEHMHTTYPDSFIGIAVHMSSGDEPEPMASSTYEKNFPAETAPICNINRTHFGVNPTKENLEIYYTAERERKSYGDVKITAVEFDAERTNIKVTTDTEFALDYNDNADFKLAYVVLENNVGPYTQLNYYADGLEGEMGGWEKLPKEHRMTYNDVARDIFNYNGIRGSVDYTITAGQKYSYTHRVSLKNVTNTDNMDIAVLLLDCTTGEIINADKLTAAEIASVENPIIENTENTPTLFYNIQGLQIPADRLAPGIYIQRQGQTTKKIVIR